MMPRFLTDTKVHVIGQGSDDYITNLLREIVWGKH